MNKIDKIVSGLFKLADKTDIVDNKTVLYLITGPTAAGKSTFRKSKTKFFVDEYPYDVDITKKNWWTKLFKYATKYKTNIIETHLLYQKNFNYWCVFDDKKLPEDFGSRVIIPPENVVIYWIIPPFKRFYQQIKRRGWGVTVKKAKCEYNYYDILRKAMGNSNRNIVITD